MAGTTTRKPQKSGSLLGSIPFFGSLTRQNSLETDVESEWSGVEWRVGWGVLGGG